MRFTNQFDDAPNTFNAISTEIERDDIVIQVTWLKNFRAVIPNV